MTRKADPVDLDAIGHLTKAEAYAELVRMGQEPHKFERKLARDTLARVHRAWAAKLGIA